MKKVRIPLVLGLLLAAVAPGPAAQATFPGRNGKIVYTGCLYRLHVERRR